MPCNSFRTPEPGAPIAKMRRDEAICVTLEGIAFVKSLSVDLKNESKCDSTVNYCT